MKINDIWLKIKSYWVGRLSDFWGEVKRLDGVSRGLALGALGLGVVYGLLPMGGLIVFMRLTSALMGARGVGVLTSLLRDALWQVVCLWVVGLLLMFGVARLRGVMKKVTETTSTVVMFVTMSFCCFLIGPFRFVLWLVLLVVAEAMMLPRRMSMIALAIIILFGLSFFYSCVGILVARSITVGGFFLYSGAVVYVTTWYVHRKVSTMM